MGCEKGEEEEHCEAQTSELLGSMLSVSSLALHGRQGWGEGPCAIPESPWCSCLFGCAERCTD